MNSVESTIWVDTIKNIRKNPLALMSFGIVLFYSLIALLAGLGLIASDYSITNNLNAYAPPSSEYLLGTDFLGRSVLQKAIQGSKIAIIIGFFSACLATFIGVVLGALAGYFGGKVDDLVVWIYTTVDSIPYILLISGFIFVLGQGLSNLYVALGLTGWVKLCRLTRAEVNRHKAMEYVAAAEALGASHLSRLFKHILPNVLHLALIQFSLTFVFAIKAEVILSYLGLGVEPGTPSWGVMINDAKLELTRGIWWNLTAAAVFMFLLILSVNIFTESLRQAMDPKLRGHN